MFFWFTYKSPLVVMVKCTDRSSGVEKLQANGVERMHTSREFLIQHI